MKRELLALALAGALCMGLTGCSMGSSNTAPDSGSSATENHGANSDAAKSGGYNNGTGQVGDLNQDEIGNGGTAADNNMNTQAKARRSANMRRTYLSDGRYEAGKDGMIRERSDLGKDLTQGARDLIRDAKELGRDMARDVGDAARSAGRAAKDTENAARNTIRDKMN